MTYYIEVNTELGISPYVMIYEEIKPVFNFYSH